MLFIKIMAIKLFIVLGYWQIQDMQIKDEAFKHIQAFNTFIKQFQQRMTSNYFSYQKSRKCRIEQKIKMISNPNLIMQRLSKLSYEPISDQFLQRTNFINIECIKLFLSEYLQNTWFVIKFCYHTRITPFNQPCFQECRLAEVSYKIGFQIYLN